MGTHLENGPRSLLASLVHVPEQDAVLCAVSDMLWHAASPICTLEGNDRQVGEPRSPVAVLLDKAPAALLYCQEQPVKPRDNARDLPADVGGEVEVNDVLFLPERFAGDDQVDRSSL